MRVQQQRGEADLDNDGSVDQYGYKMIGAFVTGDSQIRSNAIGTSWQTLGKVEILQASAVAEGTENEEVNKGVRRASSAQ